MLMIWFDDTAPSRKSAAKKIEEAIANYVERYKTKPNIVLVNEADLCEIKTRGVIVRLAEPSEGKIARNNFWVGLEDRRAR